MTQLLTGRSRSTVPRGITAQPMEAEVSRCSTRDITRRPPYTVRRDVNGAAVSAHQTMFDPAHDPSQASVGHADPSGGAEGAQHITFDPAHYGPAANHDPDDST